MPYNRKIRYTEPHRLGGEAVVTLTEQQAIDAMRAFPVHKDMSDKSVLYRFMILMGATYIEDT